MIPVRTHGDDWRATGARAPAAGAPPC